MLPEFADHSQQQQPLDSVYVSRQIKQMNEMVDETLASELNTKKIVKQLSEDIVHMQKNMNDMQQLLSSLIENQELVRHKCIV